MNLTRLFIIGAGLLIGFFSCDRPFQALSYELSPEEILTAVTSADDQLTPEEVDQLITQSDQNYRFVDVRPVAEFEARHLEGAVNVPVQNLLEEDNLDLFENTGLTFVLYGNDQLEANGSWMMLRQLGYNNVKIMQGGLDYVLAARDTTNVSLPAYEDEKACCNYMALFLEAKAQHEKDLEASKPKPVALPKPAPVKQIVPKKKKVVEEEEGC